MKKILLVLALALVSIVIAVPTLAADYADVTSVSRVGNQIGVSGTLPCGFKAVASSKVSAWDNPTARRLNITVTKRWTGLRGCPSGGQSYIASVRVPKFSGKVVKYGVYVNGMYYFSVMK